MGSFTIVQRTSLQSVANSTWAAVSWSSALVDPLGSWSAGSPTLVTVPSGITGVECLIYTAWQSNSTGERCVRLYINSTVVDPNFPMKAYGNSASHHTTRRWTVSPGDTLKWEVLQTSGAALDLYSATAGLTPYAQFKWIA